MLLQLILDLLLFVAFPGRGALLPVAGKLPACVCGAVARPVGEGGQPALSPNLHHDQTAKLLGKDKRSQGPPLFRFDCSFQLILMIRFVRNYLEPVCCW